jgi:hypothetical protein
MRARDYTTEGLSEKLDTLADLLKQEGGWHEWIGIVREAGKRLTPERIRCPRPGAPDCHDDRCMIHYGEM